MRAGKAFRLRSKAIIIEGSGKGYLRTACDYLHLNPVRAELYDLVSDTGEASDVAAQHPDSVQRLEAEAEKARAELGDALTGRTGKGTREPGTWSPPAP